MAKKNKNTKKPASAKKTGKNSDQSKSDAMEGNDKLSDILKSGQEKKSFFRAAKVGVVTALVGGIFKALAITKTFPQTFELAGNVILFLAFLIMLAAFLLGRY